MSFLSFAMFMVLAMAAPALASSGGGAEVFNLTTTPYGFLGLFIFGAAYILVIFEEQLHMRKSKPVMLAAGLIWILVSLASQHVGMVEANHAAILHNLTEYAELFLFLLAAMTYINALEERHVFRSLRAWLVNKGFSLRTIFWLTGALAFVISPVADNLTTALLMGAVAMAVGGSNHRFIALACINIVVAANAGGAFSPFGDITTLMVWQKGHVDFAEFLVLFVPSLVSWLIPALIINLTIGKGHPEALKETSSMKFGAKRIIFLFLVTITTAVCFHNFLHLPPAVGMMLGMGYLSFFSYYLKRKERRLLVEADGPLNMTGSSHGCGFDLFRKIAKAEWDTLLFFYGVILCVGGLGQLGYLSLASNFMYHDLGATNANILVGVLSSILDNIPVMFAVLSMNPAMSHGQWLLVTLTAGIGGSLLAVGSAAGVALMGSARGIYTFGTHLKWTWAIGLGYAAGIIAHLYLNASHF